MNYDDVLGLAEGIVQHKAVWYARERRVQFSVAAPSKFEGSLIWGGDSVLAPALAPEPAAKAESVRHQAHSTHNTAPASKELV